MRNKTILWDFDGVILNSMKIRDWGFKEIFKKFKKEDVDKLIEYHNLNGGLSRYVKIRYLYEKILGESISKTKVSKYANDFSILMKKELINLDNLIQDSVKFIEENYKKYNFHIVSGSDQEELRFLCRKLKIEDYFISIHGSPAPKNQLVKDLLNVHKYDIKKTYLIGDSINDYEAAIANNISFYGYNNQELVKLSSNYIDSFENISI